MRLCRHKDVPRIGLNMTPMIDIVFLLIIFFMTVSQITRNSSSEIRLAEVALADEFDLDFAVEILLDRNGGIFFESESADSGSLASRLQQYSGRVSVPVSKLQIQLRIDRDCDSIVVNNVFEILSRAGVQRVYSAVLNK